MGATLKKRRNLLEVLGDVWLRTVRIVQYIVFSVTRVSAVNYLRENIFTCMKYLSFSFGKRWVGVYWFTLVYHLTFVKCWLSP